MAADSAPCLNRLALRLICTSNSPGALFSRLSLNTVHILACQSSGTAGLEMRKTTLLCASTGRALAPRAAVAASMRRRLNVCVVGSCMACLRLYGVCCGFGAAIVSVRQRLQQLGLDGDLGFVVLQLRAVNQKGVVHPLSQGRHFGQLHLHLVACQHLRD